MVGNMIKGGVSNFPTVLQIALGVLVRDFKALVTKLHEFGVTCSYDEVLQFKKSGAIAGTKIFICVEYQKHRLLWCKQW